MRRRPTTRAGGRCSWFPAGRRVAIATRGVRTRADVAIVEPDDDLEIRVEVLVRSPHCEPCAVRLRTQPVPQEGDEALALRERPRRVVAVAGPRRDFLCG